MQKKDGEKKEKGGINRGRWGRRGREEMMMEKQNKKNVEEIEGKKEGRRTDNGD